MGDLDGQFMSASLPLQNHLLQYVSLKKIAIKHFRESLMVWNYADRIFDDSFLTFSGIKSCSILDKQRILNLR